MVKGDPASHVSEPVVDQLQVLARDHLPPEDFATVEMVAVGSERLPQAIADEFEAKFGIRDYRGGGRSSARETDAVPRSG